MDPQDHPDPLTDAAGLALQRATQLASTAATCAQVIVHLRTHSARTAAERGEHARQALTAQTRADHAAARAGWAPALDSAWLRAADLYSTARAWGAAAPYADPSRPWHDPSAAVAAHRCEQRLRTLHPYAMRRYDHLRGQGQPPADAMRQAAPFFAYAPQPRNSSYTGRRAIASQAAEASAASSPATAKPPGTPSRPGQPPPGRSRRPWRHDFPLDISKVLAAVSRTPPQPPAGGAATPARTELPGKRTGQQP